MGKALSDLRTGVRQSVAVPQGGSDDSALHGGGSLAEKGHYGVQLFDIQI